MILTLTEAEWHARRRERGAYHIGASVVAACLGHGGYSDATPLDVWRSHHDATWRPPESDRMALGTALESGLLSWYAGQTGRTLLRPRWTIATHDRYPWLSATPDAWTDDGAGLVEVKVHATRDGWGRDAIVRDLDGVDALPPIPYHHWIQTQVQMACTGRGWVDVVAMLAGDARIIRVLPSPGRTAAMLSDLAAWRDLHLVGGVRPAGSSPGEVIEDHARQYPSPHGSARATGHAAMLLQQALVADAEAARHAAERDRALAALAAVMGGHHELWISSPAGTSGSAKRTKTGLKLWHRR